MDKFLPILQIAVALLLISSILFQQRGAALGSALGGEGQTYSSRRGIQKKLLWASVVFGSLFISIAFLNLAF